MNFRLLLLLLSIHLAASILPPKFQWKAVDFAWEGSSRETALASGDFIPENNMPTGLARWQDKLFVTIPRWKKGVPSSLNYIHLNGSQSEPLHPYPSWAEAFVSHQYCCTSYNSTVVNAFRVCVDQSNRLWVVDNGVTDITGDAKQISRPAILVFDLYTDTLVHKYELDENVLRESSVLTSIVVDEPAKIKDKKGNKSPKKGKQSTPSHTFAYISDTGANAVIVYNLEEDIAWRVENNYFHFDPHAGQYKVGGVEFFGREGISGATLSEVKSDGFRWLYFSPTSSTKQFKISTKLLRSKDVPSKDIFEGVEIVGERGPKSQATACEYDPQNKVLFYTQVNKNGVGCWNTEKPFIEENTPVVMSDCTVLEYPNDIKIDQEGNIWMLSNKQSRFLYDAMDFTQVNFRVLTAPTASFIQGTTCESVKPKASFLKRIKSSFSNTKIK